ncbi:tripartite tricarboxylate transporter TctB family protein [Vibrio hannami]|uniref:tripartite tricarboxylate transporter TctB family protein n=1 Tax=Vibrio hannami TaxID=2717094 RepID=UPI0024104940|nr:tripartite tricarboxylate transporter TctB family protein [Vibrio hannami]MDG3086325.1 tripartite tricarboxylate transporter TctB family protein [Vibrio hannami]
MKERNILFPVLMVIISILALISISQFDNPRFQDASVDAKFFPTVVSCIIIVISVLLAVQSRLKKESDNITPIFSRLSIFGVGFLLAYAVLISFIGYLPASLIAFTAYLAVFKIKKPSYYAIAWTFVVGIYYLFSEVFIISLPTGSLF